MLQTFYCAKETQMAMTVKIHICHASNIFRRKIQYEVAYAKSAL